MFPLPYLPVGDALGRFARNRFFSFFKRFDVGGKKHLTQRRKGRKVKTAKKTYPFALAL
jgi:hypothetical protein